MSSRRRYQTDRAVRARHRLHDQLADQKRRRRLAEEPGHALPTCPACDWPLTIANTCTNPECHHDQEQTA
jgi:hypothetical protein